MTGIRPGLCSVTYRSLTPERIIDLAADAGLQAIEWGADVHVPVGDLRRAEHVAAATSRAGLTSCSYGSYFRATDENIGPVLDTAQALGVDRIRVWAGTIGSRDANSAIQSDVVRRLHSAAAASSSRGISLALEFHGGTIADTAPATKMLLDELGPNVSTYWQPTIGAAASDAVDEYRELADRTSAVHVFSWWPTTERLTLGARDDLWSALFSAARDAEQPPRDALLEFVPGDDPGLLGREAAQLLAYISGDARHAGASADAG